MSISLVYHSLVVTGTGMLFPDPRFSDLYDAVFFLGNSVHEFHPSSLYIIHKKEAFIRVARAQWTLYQNSHAQTM